MGCCLRLNKLRYELFSKKFTRWLIIKSKAKYKANSNLILKIQNIILRKCCKDKQQAPISGAKPTKTHRKNATYYLANNNIKGIFLTSLGSEF